MGEMRALAHPGEGLESAVAAKKRAPAAARSAVSYRFGQLVSAHGAELAAAALLLVMAANLLSVIAQKSITIDETSAIPAG